MLTAQPHSLPTPLMQHDDETIARADNTRHPQATTADSAEQVEHSPSTNSAPMEYDALSGRTIHPPSPWLQAVASRKQSKHTDKQASHTTLLKSTPPARAIPPPRLPADHYVTVFRPLNGLRVHDWTNQELSHGLVQASGIPEKQFRALITIQVQPASNLFVIGSPDPYVADRLSQLTSIPLRNVRYDITAYMKPPPGTSRGVIHGLPDDITPANLLEYTENNRPYLIHARLMGRTRSALLTFNGTRVPYYVKVNCELIRCRPYRRTIQVCKRCGDVGHRQDVCPHPEKAHCPDCGLSDPQEDHSCTPRCKLCEEPHVTAGKDCPKRRLPTPAPTKPKQSSAQQKKQQPNIHDIEYPTLSLVTRPTRPRDSPITPPQVSWSDAVCNPPTAQRPLNPPPPPQSDHTSPSYAHAIAQLQQQHKEFQRQLTEITTKINAINTSPLPGPPPNTLEPAQLHGIIDDKLTQIVKQITDSHAATIAPLCAGLQGLTDRQNMLEQSIQNIYETIHSSHPSKKTKLHP